MDKETMTPKSPSENLVSEENRNVGALSPQPKYKSILLQVCLSILCIEFCERLAGIGLASNLTIFFTKVCAKSISITPNVRSLLGFFTVQYVNGPFEYFSLGLSMLKQGFGISTVLSTELTSLFTSASYFTPILGAYVADIYLGRFALFICICSRIVIAC